MPLDLTPEQREALSGALRWVTIGPFGPNALGIINEGGVTHLSGSERDAAVDELAPVVAQMLADERERIAREIETTAAEHEAEDKAEGCNSRYCAGWLLGQKHAASIARAEPACSCPTDAEIRAAIHHSHQQLTGGNQ